MVCSGIDRMICNVAKSRFKRQRREFGAVPIHHSRRDRQTTWLVPTLTRLRHDRWLWRQICSIAKKELDIFLKKQPRRGAMAKRMATASQKFA